MPSGVSLKASQDEKPRGFPKSDEGVTMTAHPLGQLEGAPTVRGVRPRQFSVIVILKQFRFLLPLGWGDPRGLLRGCELLTEIGEQANQGLGRNIGLP